MIETQQAEPMKHAEALEGLREGIKDAKRYRAVRMMSPYRFGLIFECANNRVCGGEKFTAEHAEKFQVEFDKLVDAYRNDENKFETYDGIEHSNSKRHDTFEDALKETTTKRTIHSAIKRKRALLRQMKKEKRDGNLYTR